MFGHPLAAEAAPAAVFQAFAVAAVAPFAFAAGGQYGGQILAAEGFAAFGVEHLLKGGQMGFGKRGAFAEAGHIGAQIVYPDVFGAVFVLLRVGGAAFVEKQHVGFHALGVEDAGGQAQDGVQVAFVHQVAADVGAFAGFKQYIIGQHHGGAAAGLEVTVDVLQKGELFVAGVVSEVVAGDAGFAAFRRAKRGIGENQVGGGQVFAGVAQAVAEQDGTFFAAGNVVQQAVHQGKAAGVGHELYADKGLGALKFTHFDGVQKIIVGTRFHVLVGGNQKAGGTGGRVLNQLFYLRLHGTHHGVD